MSLPSISGFDNFLPIGTDSTLPLPLDLNTIGFSGCSLQYTSFINDTDWRIFWDALEEISFSGSPGPIQESLVLDPPVEFILHGLRFTLLNFIGEGAYGYVFKARMDTGEKSIEVAIKFQGSDTDKQKEEIIKEILIQHYIHRATSYNNHDDCSYTGQIYTVGFVKHMLTYGKTIDICIIVMELAMIDLWGFLKSVSKTDQTTYAKNACLLLARKLNNLWETYEFNHCDFHSANVLLFYNTALHDPLHLHSYYVKLADFGFSQLKIIHPLDNSIGIEIKVKPGRKNVSMPHRDIATLLGDFHYRHIKTGLSAQIELQRIISTVPLPFEFDFYKYIKINSIKECIPYNILIEHNQENPVTDIACNPPKTEVGPQGEPFYPLIRARWLKAPIQAASLPGASLGGVSLGGLGLEGASLAPGTLAIESKLGGYMTRKRKYKQRGGLVKQTRSKHRNINYDNFGSSLENYLHWLRKQFPDKKESLQKLFKLMLGKNLRSIDPIRFQGKSIKQLKEMCKKLDAAERPILFKEIIITAYFTEPDEDLSYYLLRCLLFTRFTEESLIEWLRLYMSSNHKIRHELLPRYIYTSYFI